jgi:hypothetical protein
VATLSEYWFHKQILSGPFNVFNQPFADGSLTWIANGDSSAATFTVVRPDTEIVVDLALPLNTPALLASIDALLGTQAKRTSAVKAQAQFYWQVPYFSKDPKRHDAWDVLIRLYFGIHVGTPDYCSDASGDIDYYVQTFLDNNGHLGATVDGWSFHFSGGTPFCSGSITDALKKAVPGGVDSLQGELDSQLSAFSRSTFSALYVLPGSGTKTPGDNAEDADTDAAIALLP